MLFTQYPKQGSCLDTCEPEYAIISQHEIGGPTLFRTTIAGYHGLFEYDIKSVQAIAPPDANAYHFISDPVIEWHDGDPTHHTAQVQFLHVAVDTSKRLMRANQLRQDFDKMMELLAKDE